jgi:adenine phosphoribosyltransferase
LTSRSAPDRVGVAPWTPERLKRTIRQVPDFPRPGINFFDVSTIFSNAEALSSAVELLADPFRERGIDVVAGIEARGFVLGAAIACRLGVGFVMVRKLGKLPGETEGESYELEYGHSRIEIQRDAFAGRERVLVVDDLLATGGTAAATARLVERLGGRIASFAFMVELGFLDGRSCLTGHEVFGLLRFETEHAGGGL